MWKIKEKMNTLQHGRKTKNPGESLLEVLVALMILGSVLILSFALLGQATRTTENVKNKIIALDIAREGVEAVRNIRDTNWLQYSGSRRENWLCLPTDCSEQITDSLYTVEFSDTEGQYLLTKFSTAEELNLSNKSADFSDFELFFDGTRYTHKETGNEITPFYRQITLSPETPFADSEVTDPGFCDGTDDSCGEAKLEVVATVAWQEEDTARSVQISTHLFDFFERESYE